MMNAGLGAIAPNANPMAPKPQPFQQLLALNEAVKAANLARAAQGQQAMAQAQQQQPTVKDQLMMALDQALGASNYGYAGGGIVAFADGGDINPADLEALDADIMASGTFADTMGFGATPEAMALDEARAAAARQERERRQMLDEARAAAARQERERRQIKERYEFLKTSAPETAARMLRENPWLEQNQPAVPLREAPTPPRPAPAGAGVAGLTAASPVTALRPLTPPANAGAPRPAPAAGAAAGPVAGADTSPVAGRIDLAELRKTQEALANLAGQRGAVSPAVAAAREELDRLSRTGLDPAEQQLRELEAQQQRGIFEDPEALAAMLSGMRGDMRLGETLMAMGAGAAKTRANREARVREARGRLNQLRSDLALAQAKERLARVEGDERAAREAQMQQAEIRSRIAATTVDLQFKQEDLEVRRRQAAAQERQAAAAEASVGTRAAGADESAELRRMQTMRADPRYAGLAKAYEEAVGLLNTAPNNPRLQQRVRDAEAAINRLAQEYGVARIAPTPGQATAAPGATLSAEDRALIEKYK